MLQCHMPNFPGNHERKGGVSRCDPDYGSKDNDLATRGGRSPRLVLVEYDEIKAGYSLEEFRIGSVSRVRLRWCTRR